MNENANYTPASAIASLGIPVQGGKNRPNLAKALGLTRQAWVLRPKSAYGFTLIEVILALGLGLLISGWVIEGLFIHSSLSAKLLDRLHQREFERRARRLIEDDRRLASQVTNEPGPEGTACNLAGRRPLLHLKLLSGHSAITWSKGVAPSKIWRGQVVMRCGPAYGLDGKATLSGNWQNRVVLDQAKEFTVPL